MIRSAKKAINILRADGLEVLRGKVARRLDARRERGRYRRWINEFDTLTPSELNTAREMAARLDCRPLISVLMPVYNPSEACLRAAIESVIGQIYDNWELCIADDRSTEPHVRATLEKFASGDKRIKVVFREENGHISAASNSALELVTGEYTALMDHDDELSPLALYFVAREINDHPSAGIIYSDEDKTDDRGERYAPFFKPDWSPDMLLSVNYVNHLTVYRTDLIRACGGFRIGFEGSQDYDLLLRVSELCMPENIRHIPRILYHWRAVAGSVAHASDEKPYAHDRARTAIDEHLHRVGVAGKAVRGIGQLHRVVYEFSELQPKLSVIFDGRPNNADLKKLVSQACGKLPFETILVSPDAEETADIKVVHSSSPDRFARLNAAAEAATGDVLCFVDQSVLSGSEGWLETLAGHALREHAGAVGPMIIDSRERIVNAGYVLGLAGGVASPFLGEPLRPRGRSLRLDVAQNVPAVSAVCMVIRRDVFRSAGGLDTGDSFAYGGIGLCLRLMEAGYFNIWTPSAEVVVSESTDAVDQDAIARLTERHRRYFDGDPFYNPNLTLDGTGYRLAFPPRIEKL